MVQRHPRSSLFPYTTLFRSQQAHRFGLGADIGDRLQLLEAPAGEAGHADDAHRGNADDGEPDGGGELGAAEIIRSEEDTSELQSRQYLVCRLLLEKKKTHVF